MQHTSTEWSDYAPTGLALEVFQNRYAIHPTETFAEGAERVAQHVAMAEHGEDIAVWRSKFGEIIRRNLFMPGGRIWYGSGRARGQLLNCFVVPTEDSREGWGQTVSDIIVISGVGGGVGTNYSPVRPRGMPINGTGGVATGAVSLMEVVNAAGDAIRAGGGRRTALMMCLGLSHGDIVEFLDAKLDLKKLNNANVSVVFDDDPEAFFKRVKKDQDIELTFNGNVIGRASAKQIWDKIVKNALTGGEPGLLNGYYANRMSNIWYHAPLISTNPCGEIWLSAYDCCCLGALVLPRFVREEDLDWNLLRETVAAGVRFLDDVLSVNNYPLPEISDTCRKLRRIGLGVMGLHDMLLLLGHKYNSADGLELVDKVMKFIKNAAYEASIELAKEKGPFSALDRERFLKSNFIKTLKPTLRRGIAEHGLRNCALLTIAPTGTTAIVCDCSSGIEAMFAAAYIRTWKEGDKKRKDIMVHPLLQKMVAAGRDVSHFQGAHELALQDHFEMQVTCQKHVDNAVSKTINVPQGTSHEELSELYMEYLPVLKGVTVYPDGSREDQPLTPMSLDEALKHVDEQAAVAGGASCRGGVCEL